MTGRLTVLDEHVVALARRTRSAAYRRELLRGLPEDFNIVGLRVLRSIERQSVRGEPPTVKDVAIEQTIEQSTASRAVNAVVTAGLVSRSTCEDDQRKSRLTLTGAGLEVLARATRNRQSTLRAVTSAWATEDVDRLNELLGRLVKSYDDHLRIRS